MKKGMCELCSKKARLHCESDQARLCFECDEKVHGANFLVAKHCRSLLCHVCQKPTPYKASGPKLFPIISVCVNCSDDKNSKTEQEEEEEEEINQPRMRNQETESEDDDGNQEFSTTDDDEDTEDDDEEDEDEDEDEDEGENQVVPWSPSPPLASSCSCSEEEPAAADGGAASSSVSFTLKRIRQTDFLHSFGDERARSLSDICGVSSSLSSLRPWKVARNGDSR